MSDPIVQSQTPDEKLREQLAQDAFTEDRVRRQRELDGQANVQAQRQAERAQAMGAPLGVSLGFVVVEERVWSGSLTIRRTGAGSVSVEVDGKIVDALDLAELLLREARKQEQQPEQAPRAEVAKPLPLAKASARLHG